MKARDVVPNWPRGRSTSKPYTDQVMVPKDWLPDDWKALKWGDLNAAVDREIALEEERRKAEMMEGWHLQNRRIIYDGFSGLAEWIQLMYVEPDDVGLLIVGEVKP